MHHLSAGAQCEAAARPRAAASARPWYPRAVASCVIAALVASGCSGGPGGRSRDSAARNTSSAPRAVARPEAAAPCDLLTKAEIQLVMHAQVDDGVDPKSLSVDPFALFPGVASCRFQTPRTPQQPATLVDVGASLAYGAQLFEQYETGPWGGERLTPVPGLGDKAFWSEESKLLAALRADQLVAVHVFVGDPNVTDERERATRLAEFALRRLAP